MGQARVWVSEFRCALTCCEDSVALVHRLNVAIRKTWSLSTQSQTGATGLVGAHAKWGNPRSVFQGCLQWCDSRAKDSPASSFQPSFQGQAGTERALSGALLVQCQVECVYQLWPLQWTGTCPGWRSESKCLPPQRGAPRRVPLEPSPNRMKATASTLRGFPVSVVGSKAAGV